MLNPCIEKFFPELSSRHEQLVKEGLSDREAAIKAALEQHEKIFKELQDFKKKIGVDQEKYVPFDNTKAIKEINDKYNPLIEDKKKGTKGELPLPKKEEPITEGSKDVVREDVPLVTDQKPNEKIDAKQEKTDQVLNPEKKGDTTNEPPNQNSQTTEGGENNGISKKALKEKYGFSKEFPSISDQQVANTAMDELAASADKRGIDINQQAANEVAQIKNKKGDASEHDIMVTAYHLRNLDAQLEVANNNGEATEHLLLQREDALTTLRQLGNNAGRNLRLFGSVYNKVENGRLEVVRAKLSRDLGIPEIPKTLVDLKLSKLSEADKAKVKPYVEEVEKLNNTLKDIKQESSKNVSDIDSKEVQDYIAAEVAKRVSQNKPNTPKARQKKSQDLRDLAQSIRTANGLDKFKKLGEQGGTAFNKSSIFGDVDFKELAAQAIDYIAKGVEKSEDISKLIREASLKFKGKFDTVDFGKAINKIISQASLPDKTEVVNNIKEIAINDKATSITPDMVKHGLIKDLVNHYIHSDIPSDQVIKEATKEIKKYLPDTTEKQVEDAITNRGEFKQETKKKITNDISDKTKEVNKLALKNSKKSELGNGVREEVAGRNEIKIAKDAQDFIDEINSDNTLTDEVKKEHIKSIETQRDNDLKNTRQGILSSLKDNIDNHISELTTKQNDAVVLGDKETADNIKEVKRDLQDLSKKLNPNIENLKDQIDKADQDLQAIIKTHEGTEFENDIKDIQKKYLDNWQKTADEIQHQSLLDKAIASKKESERRLAAGQFTEIPTTPYDVQRDKVLLQAEADSKKAWSTLNSMAIKAKEQRENKPIGAKILNTRRSILIMSFGAIEKVAGSGITKPLIDPLIKQVFGRVSGLITGIKPTAFARLGKTFQQFRNSESVNKHISKMNDAYVDAIVSHEKTIKEFGKDSPQAKASLSKLNEAEIDNAATLPLLFINAGSHIDIAQVITKGATDLDAKMGKYSQSSAKERTKMEGMAFWIESINRTHSAMKSISHRQALVDHYIENIQHFQKQDGNLTSENRQRSWDMAILSSEEARFGDPTVLSKAIGKLKSSKYATVRNVSNYLLPVAKISINITKQGVDMAFPFEAMYKTSKTIALGVKANRAEGIEGFRKGITRGFNDLPLEQKKYINTLIARGLFGVAQYALVGYGLSSGVIKYGGAYDPNDPYGKLKELGTDGKPLKHGQWEFGGWRAPEALNMVINHSPYSLPMSAATVSYQQLKKEDKKGLQPYHAFTKTINEVYERLPFVTGADVFKALTGDDYKLQNIVANEVPTMKNVAEYFDKDKEGETRQVEVKGTGFFNTTGNIIKSKIPFVRNSMEDKKPSGSFTIKNPSEASERDATPKEIQDYKDLKEKTYEQKVKDNLQPNNEVMLNIYGHPTISYKESSGNTKLYKDLSNDEKTKLEKSYKNQAAEESKNNLFGKGNW